MTIHVTPIPSTIDLAAPAFSLGLANTAGTAETAVASDATLLAFDTTIPSVVSTSTVSSSAGSATVAPRRDHVHGSTAVIAAATQTEMEAASSTTTNVTPGRTQYHPGVAKVWAKLNQSGGQSIITSYNCSSITDAGVGLSTVAFSTSFSSSSFVNVGSRENGVVTFNSPGTGSIRVDSREYDGTGQDSGEVYFAAWGDQ